MNSHKQSLAPLEENEGLQSVITQQALLFAELTLQEAKKNRLTRSQIINDSQRSGKHVSLR